MSWSRGARLILAALVVWQGGFLLAQSPASKSPTKEPAKEKLPSPKVEKKPESPSPSSPPLLEGAPGKPRTTFDKLKLPPGAILVVVDEIAKALPLAPKFFMLTPEQYQEMAEKIAALEKQLKGQRTGVSGCKLTGKLEEDFVKLRADFTFTTEVSGTVVFLGLKGAGLMDEGELNKEIPALDLGEEGYFLKVPLPGNHRLTLNLKLPVGLRRTVTAGSSERGFELGLPGAAVTTLNLELPQNIKEIRWNDNLEKKRQGGAWELLLGTAKALNVSWKEPIILPGSGPLLSSEGQITVKLEENSTFMQADLTLEDLRGQAKEWQLVLPPQAKVEVKVPTGLVYDLLPPEGNNPVHIIRFTEAHGERFQVNIQVRNPRRSGAGRLPVGPFFVLDAHQQKGTIAVQAPSATQRGQRLVFLPYGEVFQRDIPKGPAGQDVAAIFQYWNMAGIAKSPVPKAMAARVPLEIEWRSEKGQLETTEDHQLKLRPLFSLPLALGEKGEITSGKGLQIDLVTRIKCKSLFTGIDHIEVQLPQVRPPLANIFSWCPMAAFPGGVAWGGLAGQIDPSLAWAVPTDFFCEEEGTGIAPELADIDSQGKARINFLRPPSTKDFSLVLVGKYLIPPGTRHFRVELPRAMGTLDHGGKVTVSSDEKIEILAGPPGNEEVVPDKHHYQTAWDHLPAFLDLAWRIYRPELHVTGLLDITLRGKQGHFRQQLTFPWSQRTRQGSGTNHVRLQVPGSVRNLTVVSGGSLASHDPGKGLAWVEPNHQFPGREPLILEYDQPLPNPPAKVDPGAQASSGSGSPSMPPWKITMVWPVGATQVNAKVRVWSEPGILPQLIDPGEVWTDRGSEVVPGRDALPVLVLQGSGLNLDLTLRFPDLAPSNLPLLVCDRGLIQVAIDEAGNQLYRARYLLQRLNTDTLDVELPTPVNSAIQNIYLGQLKIPWTRLDNEWNIARLVIDRGLFRQNQLLEIEYKLPAGFDGNGHSWQTKLFPPFFRGDVFLGKVRWSASLPAGCVSVLLGQNIQQDYRWMLEGWLLTPEPSISGGELEHWLTGRELSTPDQEGNWPVSQAFSRTSQDPIVLLHLPRQIWLLLCSGLFLVGGLVLYFLPLNRPLFWGLVVCLGMALAGTGFLLPTLIPSLLFGVQPGLLVLGTILMVHWLLQERYRRQVVFMPGFTRLKPGSSLILSGGTNTKPREASTIDAPPQASTSGKGSSIHS